MRVFLLPAGADDTVTASLRAALLASGQDVREVGDAAMPLAQAERQAFLTTIDRMLECEALVVDVTRERHDAGWAIAWFLAKGRLVVLTCERGARGGLSPLLAGNPSPWQKLVLYDTPAELADLLRALLSR